MKTYIFVNETTSEVSIAELEDGHPELQSGQVFQELQEGQSKLALRYVYQDGAILDKYVGKPDEAVLEAILADQKTKEVALGIDELALKKQAKLQAIRTHFNNIVETLKLDVAPYEVATWDVQRIEYAAWLTDKTAQIPYVTALAAGRGIAVELLMDKIGLRVAGLAKLQGMQQALETMVTASTTAEEVDAVVLQ